MLALDGEARNRIIGENLRRYRLLRGFTQDEAAEGLCSISQLSKVENGKTHLKPSLLKVLAERLGVTMEQLESADSLHDELTETLELAKAATLAGHDERAFGYFRKVSATAREHGYRRIFMEAVLGECRLLNRLNGCVQAVELITEVLAEPDGCEEPKQRVELLIELGKAHRLCGNMMMAHDCYCQADEEFEHVDGKNESHLRTYYELADCHFYMQNYRTALRYMEKAEQLSQELSMHLTRIRCTYYKATILRKMGQSEKAKGLFIGTLKEAQDNQLLFDVATINNNLGCLYKAAGEYGQANAHFQRALQVYELLNQEQYLCDPYLNLAEIALAVGDVQKCLGHLADVLGIVERSGGQFYMEHARALQIRSWVERDAGKFEVYVEQAMEVLGIYAQHSVVGEAYELAVELADVLFERKDGRAVELYRTAIGLNEKVLAFGLRR
ncbi:helix-turn-helix domain-containing protein [Tumebacillus avium]|uniref:helix-turn-helix domain-containing protein n=1 Tax=Tumebacillus avium TaxID=1903704 RepID=UPI0018DEFB63|nr:helix-turn-helix domain-containing protein [Tumebacillus avium]